MTWRGYVLKKTISKQGLDPPKSFWGGPRIQVRHLATFQHLPAEALDKILKVIASRAVASRPSASRAMAASQSQSLKAADMYALPRKGVFLNRGRSVQRAFGTRKPKYHERPHRKVGSASERANGRLHLKHPNKS